MSLPQRNICLTIAYDGRDFYGWQRQPNGRTVEGVLRHALAQLHRHPVQSIAAGRTDTGVHANGQVVNFYSDCSTIPAAKFREALNSLLPPDIRILASQEVPQHFHARRDAQRRIYSYLLYPGSLMPPRWRDYCGSCRSSLSIGELNRCVAPLVGCHDFSAFAALHHAGQNAIRTVSSACFFPRTPFVVFRIVANAFLWKMVRTIVGTLIGTTRCSAEEVSALLQRRRRSPRCQSAPSAGLYLEQVLYE